MSKLKYERFGEVDDLPNYVGKLIQLVPENFYPVRVKAKYKTGYSTREDWTFWKRLYEELQFSMGDISHLTGWTEVAVRHGLHKIGTDIVYTARPHRKDVHSRML